MTRITGILHADLCTFPITSRSDLLRKRNVSGKSCKQNQNTLFMFNNVFFSANCKVYEMVRKNNVQPGTPQMTIWRTRMAFLIPKATNKYSEYAILIVFPLQQWLHERASLLRYTYITGLVANSIHS
jgi:hypothetical protein